MIVLRLYATFFVLLLTTAAMTASVVYYLLMKHRAALWLSLCMAALLCFAIGFFGLQIHELPVGRETILPGIALLMWSGVGDVLAVYALPMFLLSAFGIKPSKPLHALLWTVAGLCAIFAAIRVATGWQELSHTPLFVETVLSSVLFGVVAVSLILALVFSPRLPGKSLFRTVIVQICALLLVLPAVILENAGVTLFELFPGLGFVVSLAVVSISALAHAFSSFRRPKYVSDGGISSYFVERFGISKRELEVVQGLLDGLNNRQIGEKLFISTRTVENHLYNVYQKTGIANRLQLFNLLRSDAL